MPFSDFDNRPRSPFGSSKSLLQHDQDIQAPAHAIRQLYLALAKFGVPAVMHILPQTYHAFELILPKIISFGANAHYDVERFLALMAIDPKFSSQKVDERLEVLARYHS